MVVHKAVVGMKLIMLLNIQIQNSLGLASNKHFVTCNISAMESPITLKLGICLFGSYSTNEKKTFQWEKMKEASL